MGKAYTINFMQRRLTWEESQRGAVYSELACGHPRGDGRVLTDVGRPILHWAVPFSKQGVLDYVRVEK